MDLVGGCDGFLGLVQNWRLAMDVIGGGSGCGGGSGMELEERV